MKARILFPLALFSISQAFAAIYYPMAATSSVTGTRSVDWWIYEPDGSGTLLVRTDTDPSSEPIDALQGNASAPTGNLELFANSFMPPFDDQSASGAFATQTPIVVSGVAGPQSYTVRSLNGNDWYMDGSGIYNLAFGADNLANQWWGGFVNEMLSHSDATQQAFLLGNQTQLFNLWRDSGGFKELSDANISYLFFDDTSGFTIGLAGFLNGTPVMRERMHDVVYDYFAQTNPPAVAEALTQTYLNQIPEDINFSEVVVMNGNPVWTFDGTPSGLTTDDGSYTGNFEIAGIPAVPEPSGVMLLASSALLAFMRRRR